MSLFMMKVRLGLAAGRGQTTTPNPASYTEPLTPPSSDCGADYEDTQMSAAMSVSNQEAKFVVSEEEEPSDQASRLKFPFPFLYD